MSHQGTNWAIQQRGLKPAAKIVLWHLCDRHNPDHGCFPRQDRLAADCEMSRSTLNLHLKDLEERGLIRREQRWNPETKKQENTHYRLGFEDGFEPVNSENPCPKTGHGSGRKPVSENVRIPCPKNDDSRVRKSDTNNPVREPVREPVNEREGVREGADGEKSETVSVETWKRRFRKAHADWPSYADDSPEPTEKAWFALSEAERDKAVELQGAYVHHVRSVLKRQAICRYSVYLKEKRWERLPDKSARPSGGAGVVAPFGKAWGAQRFADLMREPYGRMPEPTNWQRDLFAKGGPMAEREQLERRAKHGWPHVKLMHDWALSHRKGVAADPSVEQLETLFGKVAKGSGIWEAWKALHFERGWPWFGSDDQCPDWVWMPAPPGEPGDYATPEDAVRAALARFEQEHATITQKDAAE